MDSVYKFVNKVRSKENFVKNQSFLTDIIFFDFISVPLTKFLSKFKFITPNGITVFALFLSLIAIYFYFLGGNLNYFFGAIIFYFADLFDGIDGKLARLLERKSEFGAKLDRYSDSFRKILAIIALTYSSATIDNYIIYIILIVFHYALNYLKYKPNTPHITRCNENGLKSFYQPWDAMFVLLVIGPIFNYFFIFLVITIALQISKIIYHLTLNFLNKD